jgi:hypothetical protein
MLEQTGVKIGGDVLCKKDRFSHQTATAHLHRTVVIDLEYTRE